MSKVTGNVKGIKNIILAELEQLYDMTTPATQVLTEDMAMLMLDISARCEREVAVYINRRGIVSDVLIGDADTVKLSSVNSRRSEHKLCGLRCIHTHPRGDSRLSDLDISALRRMRYDCMVSLSRDAEDAVQGSIACINDSSAGNQEIALKNEMKLEDLLNINISKLIESIEKQLSHIENGYDLQKKAEKAILIALDQGNKTDWSVENSLEELKQLADTAGAEVVCKVCQKKERPDAALYLGRGKLDEVRNLIQQYDVDMVVFDDELSPAQQRNVENFLGIKVLDRTALILDIFAQRARTHEGKLQVSLAQMQYNLPRIMGQGLVLSRLGGGIGTRGPGETKLETDRRYLRDRINDIKKELEQVKKVRQIHRRQRESSGILQVSLVGYTNAGKSTLLNTLTQTASQVYVANQLFATLDPTTRAFKMPNQQDILLTDTVGFIQKLPHQLVAAFRATLEEVVWADLLLHVVDVSHPLYKEQVRSVNSVLSDLGAWENKKIITVYNKLDLQEDKELLSELAKEADAVLVSAKTGEGFAQLSDLIERKLQMLHRQVVLLVPYDKAAILGQIHDEAAAVLEVEYLPEGTKIIARVSENLYVKVIQYIVNQE